MAFGKYRVFLLSLAVVAGCSDPALRTREESPSKSNPPQTIQELEDAVIRVIEEEGAPSAGLALVKHGDDVWARGFGVADLRTGRKASADTLYRQGSISKMFVSLAVLRLVEDGRLHLEDKVRDLAPEIKFENPFSASHPIRVAHLLAHTSGFDDIHLNEYASNDATPLSLKEGLALTPRSRVSRWKPGSYWSYSNAGPAVAARIVEKISGTRYEDFVHAHFFAPLSMDTAGFELMPEVEEIIARGYANDRRTELPYQHLSLRPPGALHASPREMGNFILMLLNRGETGEGRLLRTESIDRMESLVPSLGGEAGIAVGYALGNYGRVKDGFVSYGHNGVIDWGVSELRYFPSLGVGYSIAVAAPSRRAMGRIDQLVRDYLFRDAVRPRPPDRAKLSGARVDELIGYYEVAATRPQLMHFLTRLVGVVDIASADQRLFACAPVGPCIEIIPVSSSLFRAEDEPVATMAFVESGGQRLLSAASADLTGDFRKVSRLGKWMEWTLVVSSLLLMLSSVLFALVWIPRLMFGRLRDAGRLSVRAAPLAGTLLFVAIVAVLVLAFSNFDPAVLGRPNWTTISLWALTWLFASSSFGALAYLPFARRDTSSRVWLHSLLVAAANCLVAAYLSYWGVIGLRLWDY